MKCEEEYFQLAFPKRLTFSKSAEDIKRAKELISKHNGITAVYRTIYNFEGYPRTETAIIDKLFFDFDHDPMNPSEALAQLRQLHEYLKDKGLKHSMFFSGRGFHLFLFTETMKARQFHNPAAVTRNAHNYICLEADVTPDPKTKDIVRVARLPNTMHTKTKLFCVSLSADEIYKTRKEILEMAKAPKGLCGATGGKFFSLDGFDKLDTDIDYVTPTTTTIGDDACYDELPKCVVNSLNEGDCGFQERFAIITALRDLCFSKDDARGILKKFLTSKKYKHCIYEENQLDYLYERPDLLFPSCETLKHQGLCVKGCVGHDIYL